MAAQDNLVALYKEMYDNGIEVSYKNSGMLRKLVTIGNQIVGTGLTLPLIGNQKTYRRYGAEMRQPNQPITSNVIMHFETYDADQTLPFLEQYKMNNGEYVPTAMQLNIDSINQRIEQIIMNAFINAPVLDGNTFNIDEIEKGYRINGDGSAYTNAGAETKLSLSGLFKVKSVFDDMGVMEEDRFFLVKSEHWYDLLLEEPKLTNIDYMQDKNLAIPGVIYSNILGMNIIVSQYNPNGGLPNAGSVGSHYAFAFSRKTVQANIKMGDDGDTVWVDNNTRSWNFHSTVTMGAVARCPSRLIKIACAKA